MQHGWLSLYRKLMDHEIYPDPFLLKLWLHCLLKASHTERDQLVGRQVVKVLPGQFVTGRNVLASEFNKNAKEDFIVSPRTLWRWMKTFEQLQMLSIKSETKFSVVTVVNWLEYQNHDQQVSNKCPTNDQQVSTNNNVNNVNKENKKDMSIQQAEQFEVWWNLYGKKEGRAKCEPKFKQLLKKYSYAQIEEGAKRYLNHRAELKARGDFVPNQKNPYTFLHNEHFMDEYETVATTSAPMNSQVQVFELNMED